MVDQPVQHLAKQPVVGGLVSPVSAPLASDVAGEFSAIDLVIGAGDPQLNGSPDSTRSKAAATRARSSGCLCCSSNSVVGITVSGS
jgi:hypothetical protein